MSEKSAEEIHEWYEKKYGQISSDEVQLCFLKSLDEGTTRLDAGTRRLIVLTGWLIVLTIFLASLTGISLWKALQG